VVELGEVIGGVLGVGEHWTLNSEVVELGEVIGGVLGIDEH
jgi:hypothetical protein